MKGFVKKQVNSFGEGNTNRKAYYIVITRQAVDTEGEDSPCVTWILSSPSNLRGTHLFSVTFSGPPPCSLYVKPGWSDATSVRGPCDIAAAQLETHHLCKEAIESFIFPFRSMNQSRNWYFSSKTFFLFSKELSQCLSIFLTL